MRGRALPIYLLILLETIVWIAIVPLAPTFADELGLSGVETGMLLAAASLAALVVALPLGRLADRFGARRVTVASAAVFAVATLGQGVADSFGELLLSRALFGVAFAALWAAGAAWLADATSGNRRSQALAATTTVSGLGFIAGPVLAGVLADRYSTGTPFIVVGVAAAVVTVVLAFVGPAVDAGLPHQPLRAVIRAARRDDLVLAGIAIIAVVGFVGGGINLLVPLQLADSDVSAAAIGLAFSAASAIYTLVSAIVARAGDRAATLRVGGIAILATAATLVLVTGSASALAAVAFVLLRAPFWGTADTICFPLAAAGAHRSGLGQGSVMGLLTLAWASASTCGPLVAGVLADTAGERAAYATLVAICATVGVWLLRGQRRAALSTEPAS